MFEFAIAAMITVVVIGISGLVIGSFLVGMWYGTRETLKSVAKNPNTIGKAAGSVPHITGKKVSGGKVKYIPQMSDEELAELDDSNDVRRINKMVHPVGDRDNE